VDPLGVLVELRAPGAATDGHHLRHVRDEPLGDEAEAVALGQRDPGLVKQPKGQGALVEGGQEGTRQRRGEEPGRNHAQAGDAEERRPVPERPFEQAAVAALQVPDQPGVAMIGARPAREQVVGEHGRHRDGGDERRQDRDDVGDPERGEEPALDPGQREQGHEDQDHDHGRVDDAGAHLLAGQRDHPQHRLRNRPRPVLAQAPDDVLDVHDRVVDELADRDGKPAERHRVDGQPEQPEDDHRDQDRDRDGRAARWPSPARS
jgi:hypothetical protein